MHATNQISVRSVSDALKFFEQTLAYNHGELLAGDAQPIRTANTIFFGREVLNGLAMICMVLMLVPLAVMMMQLKPFARESATGDVVQVSFDKKKYWVFGVLMVATIGVPLYACGGGTIPLLPPWLADGMSMGSAATFMLTGPPTKITNLGALKSVLGIRRFVLYLLFVMAFSFVTGLTVNLLV